MFHANKADRRVKRDAERKRKRGGQTSMQFSSLTIYFIIGPITELLFPHARRRAG